MISKNKKFLYHMANACWDSNLINSLKVNGIRMEDEEELKGGIATLSQCLNILKQRDRIWQQISSKALKRSVAR